MSNPVRIQISNFQSIENLDIEIDGFTCITGKTNIGKSAIMRAISKAILNDPVVGLVRKGKSHSTVSLDSKDWGLKWEKGEKGINRYILGERTLDKTGQTQIEEIKEFGFTSVRLGGDDIQPWFAPQMDPIFLLNKSGPQITDFVSEVSGLNVLQDAIVLSSRGRKKAIEEAKSKAEEAVKIKEKIDNLSGVDDLLRLFKDLEAQRDSINEYQIKSIELEKLNRSLNSTQMKLYHLSKIESVYLDNSIIEEIKHNIKIFKVWKEMRSCADSINSYRKIQNIEVPSVPEYLGENVLILKNAIRIRDLRLQLGEMIKIESVVIPEIKIESVYILKNLSRLNFLIQSTRNIVQEIDKIRLPSLINIEEIQKLSQLFKLSKYLKNTQLEFSRIIEELSTIENELIDLEKKISKIPKCPTCGRVAIPDKVGHFRHQDLVEDLTSVGEFFLE